MSGFFFENEAGSAIKINGGWSRRMVQELFWQQLEDMDPNELRLEQDVITCMTIRETMIKKSSCFQIQRHKT